MKEPGSFYVARRGELFDGPTWQCNHATFPSPASSLAAVSKFEIPLVPYGA